MQQRRSCKRSTRVACCCLPPRAPIIGGAPRARSSSRYIAHLFCSSSPGGPSKRFRIYSGKRERLRRGSAPLRTRLSTERWELEQPPAALRLTRTRPQSAARRQSRTHSGQCSRIPPAYVLDFTQNVAGNCAPFSFPMTCIQQSAARPLEGPHPSSCDHLDVCSHLCYTSAINSGRKTLDGIFLGSS